jgi:hypothetical protein
VTVNVARSVEEAEKQLRGERVVGEMEEEIEMENDIQLFDPNSDQPLVD